MIDFSLEERVTAALLAQEDFYFYARWMFIRRKHFQWLRGPHHKIICDALMRVFLGETKRLIINVAPRYSKTELAVVNFISWCLGKVPDAEFIHTSYTASLAEMNSSNTRDLVQHEAYHEIFPNVQLAKVGQGNWTTTAGGVMYATGMSGTITGFGAGKQRPGFGGAIIIDDPHKPDEARSDKVRQGVIDNFQNTLESRCNNPKETPIILIMQCLHEADLARWLLGKDPEPGEPRGPGGNGEVWEHVCLPTLKADGTALWPEKHTADRLRVMQKAAPYMFAGQYQQAPSTPEGNIFKPDMIEIVDAIPVGTRFVRAWDFGASAGAGDYTVGGKLGQCPDGSYIIAHMVRLQGSPDEVERALVNTAKSDGQVRIRIPQDPGQAGKSQVAYLVKKLAGFPVFAEVVSGDKITRAEPFAAQVNVGNVKMLRAPWNDEVKDEMRVFPNGKHDDIEDAFADAFNTHTADQLGMFDFMKLQAQKVDEHNAAIAADVAPKGSAAAIMAALMKQNLPPSSG